MKNTHKKEYPHPYLTADVILYSPQTNSILFIQRKRDPYKDFWAFPGGFVNENEDGKSAAIRELNEETHIDFIDLQQFKFVSTPNRDPRGWIVSDVYLGIDNEGIFDMKADDDAKNVKWFSVKVDKSGLLIDLYNKELNIHIVDKLAFDHFDIVKDACKYLFDRGLLTA